MIFIGDTLDNMLSIIFAIFFYDCKGNITHSFFYVGSAEQYAENKTFIWRKVQQLMTSN